MYAILAYDIKEKRVTRVLKICRRYLTRIQNSVFEGKLTETQLSALKEELKNVINPEEDKICIYEFDSLKYSRKEEIGISNKYANII